MFLGSRTIKKILVSFFLYLMKLMGIYKKRKSVCSFAWLCVKAKSKQFSNKMRLSSANVSRVELGPRLAYFANDNTVNH